MYGLLLENLATFIKAQWGEGKWESVRRHAGIDIVAFSIHHVYPETLMRRIARSAFQILGVDERQFFKGLGVYFVQYVSQYGYDQLLSVLGRHLRDFLNGLDNLHEYLKFSYPKMRAPSFYCDDETESGLKLHYRSKRRGFVYYVMGQIKQVAKQFYNQECNIHLLTEEVVGETIHVVFELAFDNSAFSEAEELRTLIGKDLRLPVRASTLFELFPFCIVFNSEMEITHTGHTLMTILRDAQGQVMTEAFDMTRPLIPFCFSAIMQRRNNIFELVTVAPIHDVNQFFGAIDSIDEEKETEGTRLRLRGQMLYMEDWNMMLYLANPVMPDLNGLVDCSLFINDLSLHDCSRDLVLAGTQQSVELKLALDQEQQKSRKLVQSMKKLDEEMKRTDELLYQMIPKQVADRIRKGENPVETCQTFDSVSILFTDVVNFTDICSQITPLQVVQMLNHMYFLFDQLSERNGVYKVETVGDSYMVVSGAPVANINHAERICDMALDIIDASEAIDDPSGRENGLRVRVGCHSGTVVAGVVGTKMPRYCLFGDAVNTASRMESTAEPGKIQISDACKNLLPSMYSYELRGTINVKGKGELYTYFLLGREARVPLSKFYSKTIIWTPPTGKLLDGIGRPMSPSAVSHEHVESEILDLGVASPSSSGTPPYKTQRVAAAFKNPSLRAKPQLQSKFTRRSTNASINAIPSFTEAITRIATANQSKPNRTISSSELQKMSKIGSRRNVEEIESDDNIQIYFNKNLESKRKEASASLQEKHKHYKIQPTSVYDSDLIKEAFKSPLSKPPPAACEANPCNSLMETFRKQVTPLQTEMEAEAQMIIKGILPESLNTMPANMYPTVPLPTGRVSEGLLTEYIMAIEKGIHTEKLNDNIHKESPNPSIHSNLTELPDYTDHFQSRKNNSLFSKPQIYNEDSAKVDSAISIVDEHEKTDELNPALSLPIDGYLQDHLHAKFPGAITRSGQSSPRQRGTPPLRRPIIVSETRKFRKPSMSDLPILKSSVGILPRQDSFLSREKRLPNPTTNATFPSADEASRFYIKSDTASIVRRHPSISKENPLRMKFKKPENNELSSSSIIPSEDKNGQSKEVAVNPLPIPLKVLDEDDFELKPIKKEDATKILSAHAEKTIEQIISDQDDDDFATVKEVNSKEDSLITIKEGSESTTVLIGNKLAEVRVEQWIREEFAEAKNNSIEGIDSDDDSSSVDHFPHPADEKWIQEFDLDGDDHWIKDDFSQVFGKDADLKGEENLAGTLFASQASSPKTKEGKKSESPVKVVGSPKWQIEVKTFSAVKPRDETIKAQQNRHPVSKKVTQIHGAIEKAKMEQSFLHETDSCYKWQEVDTKPIHPQKSKPSPSDKNSVDPPTSKKQEKTASKAIDCKLENLTTGKEQPKLKQSPSVKSIPVPRKIDNNSKQHKSSFDLPKSGPSGYPVNFRNIEVFENVTTHPSSSGAYLSFQNDIGDVPVFPPEMTRTLQRNCTKFCYDCLSVPSYVDEDSEVMDWNFLAKQRSKSGQTKSSEITKLPKEKARARSKDRKMKQQISRLFNRLSDSVEGMDGAGISHKK